MASGNQVFEQVTRTDGSSDSRQEIGRVKEYLQEVMKKNHDLEEMLLYTTQELEKEKENSRKIVQTLTERLMESREMINKLEVENMRYKKDCILAVELLQCNKSVNQDRVSRTVKKLLNYTIPDPVVGHHTYSTGTAIAADKDGHIKPRTLSLSKKKTKSEDSNQDTTALLAKGETNEAKVEIRPRTNSKKKTTSGDSNEDTTALLVNQETNEAEMLGKEAGSPTRENKIQKEKTLPEYHQDLGKKQCEKMTEKTSLIPSMSMVNNSKQKQSDESQDMQGNEQNIQDSGNKTRYLKEEKELLTDELQHEVEDKPLIANVQTENTDSEVDGNSEAGVVEPNNEKSSRSEAECLSDEWPQEDKPLILNETESTMNTRNMKSRTENAVNACPAKSKNSVREQNNRIEESTSLMSTQEDTVNNEHEKLPTLDAETSEEKQHSQEISSEINTATSELASPEEDNSIHLEDKITKVMDFIDDDDDGNDKDGDNSNDNDNVDDETSPMEPMDNSTPSETKFKDGEKGTAISETDEETLAAEENTPLV